MADDERDENGYRLRPYPDQMRIYLDALSVVIGQTGAKGEPPGFAAALEAGERWTDGQVLKRWIALDRAIDAYPGDKYSPPADRWHKDNRVWFEIDGPLERSINLLMAIRIRWQYPFDPWKTHFYIKGGTWIPRGGGEWTPIVSPVLEPAEHEILSWAHRDLENALAHIPGDEPGEPAAIDEGDEEGPGEVDYEASSRGQEEDEQDERPADPPVPGSVNLVLGEPGDRPLIWGVPVSTEGVTWRRRKVLKALLEAGPDGLSMTELADKSGEDGAVGMLTDLLAKHAAWRRVVHMPGGPWKRYRLYQAPPNDDAGESIEKPGDNFPDR